MRSTMTGLATDGETGSGTTAPSRPFPTAEEIDWHVRNGRRLRAEAISESLRGLWRAVRGTRAQTPGLAGQRVEDGDFPNEATALRSPLMAIRSSAEILRDNPDLTPDQRARFVAILIDEERRLEWLIARAFGGRAAHGG